MCNDIFKRSKTQIEKIYKNSQKKVIIESITIISKTQVHILCAEV
jgi:hypothetical protein